MRDNEASFDKISFNLRILIITSNIDSELKETCKIWCDWWLNFRWSLFRKLFLEKRDSSFVFKIPRTIFLKMKKKKKKRKGNRSVEFLSFEDSMLVLESSTSSLLHLPYVHQFPPSLRRIFKRPWRSSETRLCRLGHWIHRHGKPILPWKEANSFTWPRPPRRVIHRVPASRRENLACFFSFFPPLFANLRPLLFFLLLLSPGRG